MRNAFGLVRTGGNVEMEVIQEGQRRRISVDVAASERLLASGAHFHPQLAGAVLTPVSESDPDFSGLPGLRVIELTPDSPAARAGLLRGDLIRPQIDASPILCNRLARWSKTVTRWA